MQLVDVPYERQEDNWKCGAAALCMVFRSFGLSATQTEIWPHIRNAYEDRTRKGARTGSLILHAQRVGLSAVGLRAARPWELLSGLAVAEVRVIVIHRRGFGSFGTHASVLRGLDDGGVVLHDPCALPDRYLGRDDFLALWGTHLHAPLARGHVLVAIGRSPETEGRAESCTSCRSSIPLYQASALDDWEELLCPHCDEWLRRPQRCLPRN